MFCSFLELDHNDVYGTIAICYCKSVYKNMNSIKSKNVNPVVDSLSVQEKKNKLIFTFHYNTLHKTYLHSKYVQSYKSTFL